MEVARSERGRQTRLTRPALLTHCDDLLYGGRAGDGWRCLMGMYVKRLLGVAHEERSGCAVVGSVRVVSATDIPPTWYPQSPQREMSPPAPRHVVRSAGLAFLPRVPAPHLHG